MKRSLVVLALATSLVSTGSAQTPPAAAPSPGEIVAAAPASEWIAIASSDLLVMDLAPSPRGPRRVVIQLMPAPFSQGWIGNIRKLAAARWWDGTSVNRVQDNYVVQWGDATEKKVLPEGLVTVGEGDYLVDVETLKEFTADFFATDDERESHQPTDKEKLALVSIEATQGANTSQGWHERDSFSEWVEHWKGWPIANFEKANWYNHKGKTVPKPMNTQRHVSKKNRIFKEVEQSFFWPVHCYGMVGVGRNMSPDTGSGAELYTVIGHAPRHLDRNIALVGRVIEGIEHLSSLPRGSGALGFYEKEEERVPILSVRIGFELSDLPMYQYLSTDSATFAKYTYARTNRRDPFFNVPAGGADICNIPVPVRRVPAK